MCVSAADTHVSKNETWGTRVTWATLYNGVGSVKGHVSCASRGADCTTRGFDFPFVELLVLLLLIRPKARFQNRAVEGLVPPTIYPVTDFRP